VDIRSETEFAAEEAEHGYEEEEVQGRCAAILSNGRRCPNAALPGSRYCGLESHQALAEIATDNIVDLGDEGAAGEGEQEVRPPDAAAESPATESADAAESSPAQGQDEAAAPELGDAEPSASGETATSGEAEPLGSGETATPGQEEPAAVHSAEPAAEIAGHPEHAAREGSEEQAT
jgi:transcription termination/antitermination protein NusA